MLVQTLLSLLPCMLYAAVHTPFGVIVRGPPPPTLRIDAPPTTRFIIELGVRYDEMELYRWPDYDYYFAAKITPAQWERFRGTLGADWKPGGIWSWDGREDEPRPAWWGARDEFDGLNSRTGRIEEYVKYEGGVLYYRSRSS